MANFTGKSIQNTYQRVLQLDTGSLQDGLGNVVNIPISQLSGSTLISSSIQIASDISGSITSFSGSIAGRVETNETNITALNGATGSYLLNTTDTLTGNLTVTGTLTAQEFHTEFVSASILFDSGSTKFGDTSDDNHDFTGSLNVLGSITGTVNGYLPLSAGSTNPLTGDLYIEEDSLYLLNASNNYWRVQNNSSGKLTFNNSLLLVKVLLNVVYHLKFMQERYLKTHIIFNAKYSEKISDHNI